MVSWSFGWVDGRRLHRRVPIVAPPLGLQNLGIKPCPPAYEAREDTADPLSKLLIADFTMIHETSHSHLTCLIYAKSAKHITIGIGIGLAFRHSVPTPRMLSLVFDYVWNLSWTQLPSIWLAHFGELPQCLFLSYINMHTHPHHHTLHFDEHTISASKHHTLISKVW